MQAIVYWKDKEGSWIEENKYIFDWDENEGVFNIAFRIPDQASELRFCPMNCPGIVSNIHFSDERTSLKIAGTNGLLHNREYIFYPDVPEFVVIVSAGRICRISALIEILDNLEKEQLLRCYTDSVSELQNLNKKLNAARNEYSQIIGNYSNKCETLAKELENTKTDSENAEKKYYNLLNSRSWKLTAPLRKTADIIKKLSPFDRKRNRTITEKPVTEGHDVSGKEEPSYRYSYYNPEIHSCYTEEDLETQKAELFPEDVQFSIAVPLHNTPEVFLHEMLRSVLDQSYSKWELCLADGSDSEHGYVEGICHEYSEKDNRIKYRKLEKNLGISGNTNCCLEMASGSYIGLLDQDDLLHPAALYEIMKAVCEKNGDFIYTDEKVFTASPDDKGGVKFKPDYAPDTLRSYNYICHFTVFKKELLEIAGRFNGECDGSQDYDLFLRLTEAAKTIVHIPQVLYFWRSDSGSTAGDVHEKPYASAAAHKALESHLSRVGLEGMVEDSVVPTTYRIRYSIIGEPKVSIVIPNKDQVMVLKRCIGSICEKTSYNNYEIIIVENGSINEETFSFYGELMKRENIKIVTWKGKKFNYSAINNYGVEKAANGEYFLLLNNDTEVITPDWIQEMLMFAQRKDVGAVGSMLYYHDDTVQHAGVVIGINRLSGHVHRNLERGRSGYMARAAIVQNLSAVTGACMMIRRDVWDEINGLDEEFEVAFNDIDLCLRVRKAGYLIVWTPYAELYHYESKSRGYDVTDTKKQVFSTEAKKFRDRWSREIDKGDPYYNPNLTLTSEDFSIRIS